MNLLDDLPANALVGLDTMVWIYELEDHPQFGSIVHSFFTDGLKTGRLQAGSSLLALGELLVRPLAAGRPEIADIYRGIFISGSGFFVWEITRAVVETAASLRAKYRLKMIDALHVASALVNGAGFFLSNDEELRHLTEIKVLHLGDYLSPGP